MGLDSVIYFCSALHYVLKSSPVDDSSLALYRYSMYNSVCQYSCVIEFYLNTILKFIYCIVCVGFAQDESKV